MATTKLTISVPEELAAHIRDRVARGEFASVSAFLTLAGETLRDFEPLDLLIASMVAETGEPGTDASSWLARGLAGIDRADEKSRPGAA